LSNLHKIWKYGMEIGEKLITLLTCYYYAIILYDHTYILYEVLHWGLINEDITHLKGIALTQV